MLGTVNFGNFHPAVFSSVEQLGELRPGRLQTCTMTAPSKKRGSDMINGRIFREMITVRRNNVDMASVITSLVHTETLVFTLMTLFSHTYFLRLILT